jgi:type IV pilus assembly protein PilA
MSDQPQSKKSRDLALIVAVVLGILCLVAAIAWTQSQKPDARRQDKSVTSNLRMLSTGAEQYYTESGMTFIRSVDLMGTNPTQYVKAFVTVAGETYNPVFVSGQPITASGIAGARTVTFGP